MKKDEKDLIYLHWGISERFIMCSDCGRIYKIEIKCTPERKPKDDEK